MPNSEIIHLGYIEFLDIQNIWPNGVGIFPNLELVREKIKIVHYPDCQQLIIWLPESGAFYENIKIISTETEECFLNSPIQDVLNGSIQIIINTLSIPPIKFLVLIQKSDGLQHIIQFLKHDSTFLPATQITNQQDIDTSKHAVIQYKDGLGQVLENEDLKLREKISREVADRLGRKVEYESYGRSGKVIYIEGKCRLEFFMEMGGGNCMFYLEIPSEDNWESQTGFSIKRRNDIIEFVSRSTWRDQGPHTRMEILSTSINYYNK